ncbi:serine hydrolase [Antrihabitans sp. YC2-6]|uniref:serine hydrolase domain-containing protein n=1 Tax=Antrihabitans sp. YC2-6 TaxID=2799498 RepID=UPI0018F43EBE|nr:serine hydrolase domain-containing protein [Antrihabitans sp. YC2-6]MBJ8344813.1 beta-lactamase family protein [Antrihabitans sp. YC2-6]
MTSLDQVRQWPVDNASAAVVGKGGVLDSYGDMDRVYPLASVTKLLVAYGALVAIEEGAIELDQPAGPAGSTVRHLLAHASGLAFDQNRVQAPPGERRIYSSEGFEVLAGFIEYESTIPFAEYLHEAVFVPLAMASSALTGPAGHAAESTAGDLARFAGELLSPSLISEPTLRAATTVQYPGLAGILPGFGQQRPNDWGLGFEIRGNKSPHWTGESNSPRTFGHFGQSGTFLWVDPESTLACVGLSDRAFGDWAKVAWPDVSDTVIAEFG